jgi:hypothetical protein
MIGILVKTHFIDESVLATLAAMRRDLSAYPEAELVLGLDVSKGLPLPVIESRALLRQQAVHLFSDRSHLRHGLREYAARRPEAPFNWFHSDFSLIDFYLCNPGRYEALWQVEYDVFLRSGSWDFLAKSRDFDLLAPGLKFKHESLCGRVEDECPIWPDWKWWERLEGIAPTMGCFFPCIRVSARALDRLVAAYRSGINGYCEASLPSVLYAEADLRLASLARISEAEAVICHPHWSPRYKQDRSRDFQLNQARLVV